MTELILGTKKGLFVLSDDGSHSNGGQGNAFSVAKRAFAGEPVEYATRDPRTGRYFAGMTSPFYGPKLFYTDDLDAPEWNQAEGLVLPESSDQALQRIWVVTPGEADGLLYLGGDPGVLFESRDGGATWALNEALFNEPSRKDWQPGGGGLCLHSIVPWPGDPDKLLVAISAAGIWITDDGGHSWRRGNKGILPRYLPEEQRENAAALCVHHVERSPANPERLFLQFHGGVYRSDDAGQSWNDISEGLISDFGFPLAVDPQDPDSAFVIPLRADMDRVTPEGHVRVYETRDAGATWTAQEHGLPQDHAYLTVLRLAFSRTTGTQNGNELELYFGSTTGEVFGTRNAGGEWFLAASRLPPIYSIGSFS